MAKQAHFENLQKNKKNMFCVASGEKSKSGLGFQAQSTTFSQSTISGHKIRILVTPDYVAPTAQPITTKTRV